MAAAEGDWATRLLRLELALDAVRAGADPDDVDSTVLQLIDLSRTLDSTTELTRRVRAAVQLELAGAAAALAADVGIESLAAQALALARGAGPPLSSTRAVLFGTVEFRPDRADGPKICGSREAPLIALPQGVAELSYLRFGDRS